jgi:hypothetical protein
VRGWMASLGATLLSGAVLAAGLALGTPAVPPVPDRVAAIPDAPHADDASPEVGLGDRFELGGMPSRLSMFWTPDEAREVLATYLSAWEGVGEPIVRRLDRVTSLSVVEADTGMMRSVQITDLGDLRLVVPNLVDVRRLPTPQGPEASPVPVPENAAAYLSQVVDEPRGRSHHASYLAPMNPATAIEFYRQTLGPLGYAERPSLVATGRRGMGRTFVRGPESVEVLATPTEESSAETAFVVVEHLRVPAGEEAR